MAEYLVQSSPFLTNSAILIARLFIGACFIVHGLGKLGIVGPGSMAGFAGWLKSMGIPFPEVQARLAMLAELVGGVLIVLGLGTRLGLTVAGGTVFVAAVIGHKGGGYLITNSPPGNEYALNLAAICLVLFLLGPGAYSFDALFLAQI